MKIIHSSNTFRAKGPAVPIRVKDRPQTTTTKLVTLGLGNPNAFVPRDGEQTWPGFLTHVIHGCSSLKLIMIDQLE